MGLETLGQHIAGIRHTEAATREVASATRTREALLPGRVESLDLSNEQANLMLSELYKDADLRAWARDNEILEAQALNEYYTNNKEDLFANVAIREKAKLYGNSFELATKEADMIYLNLDPLLTELTNVMNSPELTPEQANQAMQGINQVYDGYIQSWQMDGTLGEEDRQEDGIIRPDGGLPGGVSQGDPLTKESIGALKFTRNVMGRMSEIGREEQAKLAEKALGPKEQVDLQGKRTEVGGKKADLMLEHILGTFPETSEVTDTGKRTIDKWESANTNLKQLLEQAMTDTGDPMADAQVLNDFMRKSLQTAEVGFDAKGFGGGDVYTYAPSAQLGTFKGPGGIQMSRDIYINMLKEAIHLKSEEEAQNIANQMFNNMVTSLPR